MCEENTKTRHQILDLLTLVRTKDIKGELYFLLKKEGKLTIKKGDLDPTTQIKLTRNFALKTYSFFDDDKLVVMGLTEADDRNNVVYRYDYPEPLEEFILIESVQKSISIDKFSLKNDNLSEIKGYIFAFVHKDVRITLYKENYEVMMIKKNMGDDLNEKINIVLTGSSQLKEFEDQILRLNFSFDFILLDSTLYIKELGKLEQRFGFQEVVKKKAKKSIRKIMKLDLVKDISSLEEDINDVSFARKIVNVASKSAVLQTCSKSEIMGFISSYDDKLKSKFKFDESMEYLYLDTRASRDAFIKLLDDSYLYSQLTKQKYVSGAKDKIN